MMLSSTLQFSDFLTTVKQKQKNNLSLNCWRETKLKSKCLIIDNDIHVHKMYHLEVLCVALHTQIYIYIYIYIYIDIYIYASSSYITRGLHIYETGFTSLSSCNLPSIRNKHAVTTYISFWLFDYVTWVHLEIYFNLYLVFCCDKCLQPKFGVISTSQATVTVMD